MSFAYFSELYQTASQLDQCALCLAQELYSDQAEAIRSGEPSTSIWCGWFPDRVMQAARSLELMLLVFRTKLAVKARDRQWKIRHAADDDRCEFDHDYQSLIGLEGYTQDEMHRVMFMTAMAAQSGSIVGLLSPLGYPMQITEYELFQKEPYDSEKEPEDRDQDSL
jgi:hypothetical protein